MSPFERSARKKLLANGSGQAAVEFAFVVTRSTFVCALIDFGRALYDLQVLPA